MNDKVLELLLERVVAQYFSKHLAKMQEMVAFAVSKILKQKSLEIDETVRTHLKGEKGDAGKPGKDADSQAIFSALLKELPKPVPGEKGADGLNGKDGSPDTGEQIVTKINALPTDDPEKMIGAEHIKNLHDLILQLISLNRLGGSGGRGGYALVSSEQLLPTISGNNITLDLSGLSHTFVEILGVYRNGVKLTPNSLSGWTRSANIATVYNAATNEDFLVDYTFN